MCVSLLSCIWLPLHRHLHFHVLLHLIRHLYRLCLNLHQIFKYVRLRRKESAGYVHFGPFVFTLAFDLGRAFARSFCAHVCLFSWSSRSSILFCFPSYSRLVDGRSAGLARFGLNPLGVARLEGSFSVWRRLIVLYFISGKYSRVYWIELNCL